jgi:hypothetical protein
MQKIGIRILVALLLIGGVLGIVLTLYMGYGMLQQHWIYGLVFALFALLFAYSTFVGFQLWQGHPLGRKRAMILFATQVPVFTLPGVTYEWYTGLAFKIMGGHIEKSTVLGLGSSINFYLDTRITDIAYGVNVVALVALLFLVVARPNHAFQGALRDKESRAAPLSLNDGKE